jgi:EAL domain-containing protein (putative c-di-GMP-specific phosphodiesterase class I)
VIAEIHDAIKNKRIFPYFQPIYSVKTSKVIKYESLMRIQLRDGSIVAPAYFLEISHQAKLYPKLSMMMLEAVLEQAKEYPKMHFSFNLSAVDIEDIVMAEFILRTLKSSSVAKQLTLEILETEGFHSYKTLALFISEVKSYGVTVAIDDFGSGYSNFAEIVELNVDYLKIDGSLVKQITTDPHYEHIIIAIIKFAQSLDLQTIAEFVEDETLAQRLIAMGVDMLQGYYIGRPKATCD